MNWRKQVDDFKANLKVESPSMATSFIRFGFFGLVGGGKSVTAGILAVSITPDGPIGWIDGEGKRSGFAIDQVSELASKHYGKPAKSFSDRFKVVHVNPPFNPLVGVAAIETLEQQGCKTIIADFCSQIWDSEGGYMDMREEEIDKMTERNQNTTRQKVASAAAAHVKPWTHGKFVSKVNSCACNIILVFQAKSKWNPKANKPDDFISPIQESGLTRTAIAVGRVDQNESGEGGFCSFRLPLGQGTKYTHPRIAEILPKNNERLTFSHGEALLKWVCGESKPTTKATSQPSGIADIRALKKQLWELTMPKHGGDERALEQWLIDESCISDTEDLKGLPVSRYPDVIEKARLKMQPQQEAA